MIIYNSTTANQIISVRICYDRTVYTVSDHQQITRPTASFMGDRWAISTATMIPAPEFKPDPLDPRRWFDFYRMPERWPRLDGIMPATRPYRMQARCDHAERRRNKRKQWLETLRD